MLLVVTYAVPLTWGPRLSKATGKGRNIRVNKNKNDTPSLGTSGPRSPHSARALVRYHTYGLLPLPFKLLAPCGLNAEGCWWARYV